MKINKRLQGKGIEVGALEFLKRKWPDLEVWGQNTYLGHRELDLIVKVQNSLVFIEVRSRSTQSLSGMAFVLPWKKRLNLKKAISQYMRIHRHKIIDANVTECRVDLVYFTNALEWLHLVGIQL